MACLLLSAGLCDLWGEWMGGSVALDGSCLIGVPVARPRCFRAGSANQEGRILDDSFLLRQRREFDIYGAAIVRVTTHSQFPPPPPRLHARRVRRQPCSWQRTISARRSRPNGASSCLYRISLRRACRPTWYAEAGGVAWRTGSRCELGMVGCGSQGVSYADAASRSLGGSWPGRLQREYMRPRSWLLS